MLLCANVCDRNRKEEWEIPFRISWVVINVFESY